MCHRYLVRAFCKEYPINQESNEAGEPGSECRHVSRVLWLISSMQVF